MVLNLMMVMSLLCATFLVAALIAFACANRAQRHRFMAFWMGVCWALLMGAFFSACWIIGGALALITK